MKKFTKIIAGITAVILTLGIAGCEKDTYPDFINPENPGQIVQTNEKYVINVQSAGGLKLNNVKVTAVNANGQKVKSGISKDGKIELNVALGEYTLEVDESTLPAGYYLDGTTFKTNPEKREEVTVSIPSRVIEQTATGSTRYAIGDIVHDFTLTDYRASIEDGYKDKQYKVSDLLKVNKAVVLNFWYPDCVNCTAEFPALQRAYAASSGVEILGICTPSYVDLDIVKYKTQHSDKFNLTFPMGIDRSGIASKFGVNAWPVTVVIDRYGLIAYREEGAQPNFSAWKSLFDAFTADDYKQNLVNAGTPGTDPGTTSPDREKPNVEMPASSVMEKAANGLGFEARYSADAKDEYAWPWTNGTDSYGNTYIMSTNKGKSNSYSTVYVNFSLKQGDMLCFDYRVSSERNSDFLYVFLDGVLINGEGWSGDSGWVSKSVYVADRTKDCELAFIFDKDSGDPDNGTIGDDVAMIRNLHVESVSPSSDPLDIMRECASGEFKGGKYSYYVTPVMGDDGFYHKDSKNGPLIYITINNITPWSAAHTTDNHFDAEGGSQYATLYYMTYYKYSKTVENAEGSIESFTVNMGGRDYSAPLIAYHHMLDMLEAPYYLMPVTRQLYEWANAFTTQYSYEQGTATHENEWLEFCYYYDHYGSVHPGDKCKQHYDETKGLTIYNCDEVFEKKDTRLSSSPAYNHESGKNTATVAYPLSIPNGVYYKFTPTETGVYQIRDYFGSAEYSPTLDIYTLEQDGLTENFVAYSERVLDYDQFSGVGYGSFNCYTELKAGETVYLFFRVSEQITASFDFEIIYLGKTYEKMMLATTAGGAWTYDENFRFIYLGIDVAYDSTTEAFYKAKADGSADLSKPVYIDMFNSSFFISNDADAGSNYKPLSYFVENNYFAQMFQGTTIQNKMRTYLEQAKASPDKLIKADKDIVEYINMLYDAHVDGGRGDGRGWLAFACYTERWGS